MTCTMYCVKIEEIFDVMIRLAYEVLPENRSTVETYILVMWKLVASFMQSIKRKEGTEELISKFQSYVVAEEARLRRNLEDIKYQIDGPEIFRIVSGEGRLETVSQAVCNISISHTIIV